MRGTVEWTYEMTEENEEKVEKLVKLAEKLGLGPPHRDSYEGE